MYMKKILILLWVTFCSVGLSAQQTPIEEKISAIPAESFILKQPFTAIDPSPAENEAFSQVLQNYQLLHVDQAMLNSLASGDIPELSITILIDGAEETLQLIKNNVVDAATVFSSLEGEGTKTPVDYNPGAYYYGVIKNHPHSVVGLSFFQNNVMGLISTENGNYVLGKTGSLSDDAPYILYNDKDMLQANTWSCGTQESNGTSIPTIDMNLAHKGTGASSDQCVRVYIYIDYQMYLNMGSDATNTFNYATGLFNLVSTLYQNESISIAVSGMSVWITTDPFASAPTTLGMLKKFSTFTNTYGFDGSIAHLLSGRNLNGGIAYLDVLCCTTCFDTVGRTAVSTSLTTSITPLPTYSWNVNCVTHEIGHNLGSPHTHACAWNNNNTAIDACGPYYGYLLGITPQILFEGPGSCGSGYMPTAEGGTIMSYCHLGPAGIKFSNGFGPQPGDLIRGRVANAACLLQCDRRCPLNVTFPTGLFSFTYYNPLTESQTWIKSNGSVQINPTGVVKLDADPVNGYVLLNPGLVAAPQNDNAVFIAQALDGCASAIPQRPAPPTQIVTPITRKSSGITAYPNPATNRVTIKITVPVAKGYRIDIYDINSRLITSFASKGNQNTVDISGFNPGMYLVRAHIDDRDYSCKFLKTN